MIKISIDLNKINKAKIKPHANGAKYYDIIVDTRQTPDNFGNTHTVYEGMTKEEREARTPKNYIGNGKEYIFGNQGASATVHANAAPPAPPAPKNAPTTPPIADDLPF